MDDKKKWSEAAEKARSSVQSANYGRREDALRLHAIDSELSVQTLRKSISAYEFAISIRGRYPDVDLTAASLAAVEEIKRWASYDEGAAVTAARRLLNNELSVRGYRELERKAREGRSLRTSDAAPRRILHSHRVSSVGAKLTEKFGKAAVLAVKKTELLPPIDFVVSPDRNPAQAVYTIIARHQYRIGFDHVKESAFVPVSAIAVIVHMQIADQVLNNKQLLGSYMMGFGLLQIFGSVFIYVFSDEEKKFAIEWAEDRSILDDRIVVCVAD